MAVFFSATQRENRACLLRGGWRQRRISPGNGDPEAPVDATSDISRDTRILLEKAIEIQSLSARGFHRILRVARTIADLERSDRIERRHLAEALAYRAMPLLA